MSRTRAELIAASSFMAVAIGMFWCNANSSFSIGNPLAANSRFHVGVPPGKGPGAAY